MTCHLQQQVHSFCFDQPSFVIVVVWSDFVCFVLKERIHFSMQVENVTVCNLDLLIKTIKIVVFVMLNVTSDFQKFREAGPVLPLLARCRSLSKQQVEQLC